MAEILERLPDDLKLIVATYCSAYKVDIETRKKKRDYYGRKDWSNGPYYTRKFVLIKNIAGDVVFYNNMDIECDDDYNGTELPYEIMIEDEYDDDDEYIPEHTGFDICRYYEYGQERCAVL